MVKVIYVDYNCEIVTQYFDENGNFTYEERESHRKAELFAGETIIHKMVLGIKQ